MKKIRILIADDHGVIRNGLRLLFEKTPEFSVVAEASTGDEAITLSEQLKPDVAIIDISMPGTNGIEATRAIRQKSPESKILILTMHESEGYVYQMLREGVGGYVLKNAEKEELFAAVRAVSAGETYFSPSVSKLIINDVVKNRNQKTVNGEKDPQSLTKREIEVLRYIADGMSNRQIAVKIHLSVRTVNTHRANIMRKLEIHDTATLVRYALQHGIAR